jgi:hypothetical protein
MDKKNSKGELNQALTKDDKLVQSNGCNPNDQGNSFQVNHIHDN